MGGRRGRHDTVADADSVVQVGEILPYWAVLIQRKRQISTASSFRSTPYRLCWRISCRGRTGCDVPGQVCRRSWGAVGTVCNWSKASIRNAPLPQRGRRGGAAVLPLARLPRTHRGLPLRLGEFAGRRPAGSARGGPAVPLPSLVRSRLSSNGRRRSRRTASLDDVAGDEPGV